MTGALSHELHALTARLDREADRLLRITEGLSYSRFLALLAVRKGAETQRDVARWLGQSEASTSRMTSLLAEQGLLAVRPAAGEGNRHRLSLTRRGLAVVTRGADLLETEFLSLVERSGISHRAYQRATRLLLKQLDAEHDPPGRRFQEDA